LERKQIGTEEHRVKGRSVRLCVHRKGATRAFPPGHPAVPQEYRAVGQPACVGQRRQGRGGEALAIGRVQENDVKGLFGLAL